MRTYQVTFMVTTESDPWEWDWTELMDGDSVTVVSVDPIYMGEKA